MTSPPDANAPAPLLRTLAPALRNLERAIRAWLEGGHAYPLKPLTRATLEGLVTDLRRKSEDLDVERPHLVVMLMGGTGVGKSSLLSALAGGPIAQASYTRPTTRDPVVYHHRSLRPEQLDPALRHCKLVAHDRAELEHKVLVDTPDLDSNEPQNRAKLEQILPVADVVLYVGSQEKYHDRLGWDMFRGQRQRRAFAFVLNKWDRCLRPTSTGKRPDDDLLRDLAEEGFQSPLLFRTSAQYWIDRAQSNGEAPPPPDGEQFQELTHWLELGLTRLEIEAVKARGVGQLLAQCEQALAEACPPEVGAAAEKTRTAWEAELNDEAGAFAQVLLTTLEPNQQEIEHHFRLEGQRRFRGPMAAYLRLLAGVQHAGSRLRDKMSIIGGPSRSSAPTTWDLAGFTHECIRVAGDRSLDQRVQALKHRLLVQADEQGFPPDLLPGPTADVAARNWRSQFEEALNESLNHVERQWSSPSGIRGWVQAGLVWVANVLPETVFLAALIMLFWRYFMATSQPFSLFDVFLPVLLTLAVLVMLHLIMNFVLPLRWPKIRGGFQRELQRRLAERLIEAYGPLPGEVAERLAGERRTIERLQSEVGDIAGLLDRQQRAANVEGLYGR
jgi:hypothetical protein